MAIATQKFSFESTPLLQITEHPDYVYLNISSLLRGEEKQDPSQNIRRILKVVAYLCSAGSKPFFFSIGWRVSPTAGPLFGTADSLAYFTLETWAASKGLDCVLGPKTQEEALMQIKESRTCRTILVLTAATILSAATQLPPIFAAMKYNPNYQIIAAIMVGIAGTFLPLTSIRLSIEATRDNLRGPVEKKLLKMRSDMTRLLRLNFNARMENPGQLQNQLGQIIEQKDTNDKSAYYQFFLQSIQDGDKNLNSQRARQLGEALGFCLNIVYQCSWGAYAYWGTREFLYDDESCAATMAALTVASNLYLVGTSLQKTTGRVTQLAYDRLTGHYQKTLVERLKPKLAFSLQAIGLLIDGLGLCPTIIIWSDFFTRYSNIHIGGTVTMSLAIFILLFTAMSDTIDDISQTALLHQGTALEKEILELHAKMHLLAQSLDTSPLLNFAVFILNFPETERNQLLEKFNLSKNVLDTYVESRSLKKSLPV